MEKKSWSIVIYTGRDKQLIKSKPGSGFQSGKKAGNTFPVLPNNNKPLFYEPKIRARKFELF